MKLNNKRLLSLSITLALTLTNCVNQPVNTLPQATQINDVTQDSISQISGTVNFPQKKNSIDYSEALKDNPIFAKLKSRFKNTGFNTKAVMEQDVKGQSTVSLLYPPDFATTELQNVTIATGITGSTGHFSINLKQNDFEPETGQVYVLEAIKRLGSAGIYIVSLRTYIRWTGSKWESMTTPGIDINLVTTGLAIISNLNPERVPSADTIGKIKLSSGIAQVKDIKDSDENVLATKEELFTVIDLENQALYENQDPFAVIYQDGDYQLNHTMMKPDTHVNSFTSGTQAFPSVATDHAGDFVVTWTGNDDGNNKYGIYAQRYNNSGEPLGSEFRVSSPETTDRSIFSKVAMDDDGDFVITWSNKYSESGLSNVMARRYDSEGQPVGSEFIVDSFTTTLALTMPSVAMDNTGDFVITWSNKYSSNNNGNQGVFAKRYNNDGQEQGSEFIVRSDSTSSSFNSVPSVALDDDGDFVITWTHVAYQDSDNATSEVLGKRYNKSGVLQGNEFLIDSMTAVSTILVAMSSVAMDSQGDFVVTWDSKYQESNINVLGRRYNKSGAAQGAEFSVDSYTISTIPLAISSVSMDSPGNFVITWARGNNGDGSGTGIFVQRYKSNGKELGSEFLVNTETNANQQWPAVAMDSSGDFAITWMSPDENNYGVFAKRYNKFGVHD
jgi:hypothetical protein